MRALSCVNDEHGYGISVAIGGGLLRRTCKRCGGVELDMRAASTTPGGLFEHRPRRSLFALGWADVNGGLNFATGA